MGLGVPVEDSFSAMDHSCGVEVEYQVGVFLSMIVLFCYGPRRALLGLFLVVSRYCDWAISKLSREKVKHPNCGEVILSQSLSTRVTQSDSNLEVGISRPLEQASGFHSSIPPPLLYPLSDEMICSVMLPYVRRTAGPEWLLQLRLVSPAWRSVLRVCEEMGAFLVVAVWLQLNPNVIRHGTGSKGAHDLYIASSSQFRDWMKLDVNAIIRLLEPKLRTFPGKRIIHCGYCTLEPSTFPTVRSFAIDYFEYAFLAGDKSALDTELFNVQKSFQEVDCEDEPPDLSHDRWCFCAECLYN